MRIPTLLTVSQFTVKHRFISNSGLRYQIFNEKNNGLEKAGAIIRIGRRILIDEERYFSWIYSQQKIKRIENNGN